MFEQRVVLTRVDVCILIDLMGVPLTNEHNAGVVAQELRGSLGAALARRRKLLSLVGRAMYAILPETKYHRNSSDEIQLMLVVPSFCPRTKILMRTIEVKWGFQLPLELNWNWCSRKLTRTSIVALILNSASFKFFVPHLNVPIVWKHIPHRIAATI